MTGACAISRVIIRFALARPMPSLSAVDTIATILHPFAVIGTVIGKVTDATGIMRVVSVVFEISCITERGRLG
jgi:hypothetical protein